MPRFHVVPLELRFSKYHQMSGDRFLIGKREIKVAECVLLGAISLKESIDKFNWDLRKEDNE